MPLTFRQIQSEMPHFYRTACDYSRTVWDALLDHLREVLREDVFKHGVSAAAAECCECVQARVDVYIPHRNYQIKWNHCKIKFLQKGS